MNNKRGDTDILLINPPSTTVQNNPIPFGLTYLASFLEKNKFKVGILDLSVDVMTHKEIINYIKKLNPSKIGISCMSVHIEFIKKLSKKIKKNFPDKQLLIGGIHPTALPIKSAQELKDIDLFIIGEGELTLLEILKGKKLEKIKGLVYRDRGKIIVTKQRELIKDLDKLPFSARHLLPSLENYGLGFDWEGKKPAACVFTTRGCPFNCIYCASKVMWRRKVRFRTADNVLSEIDELVKEHKIKEILFYDDHFVLNKKRLKEICNGLIKRNYKISWCCFARVESIDLELARLMKKTGCHMISFGVESGSQTILDTMKKGNTVEQVLNVFKICKKARINTKASFIFGSPNETYETIKETKKVIKKIMPDYVWFFIMTPLPETELYKLHEKAGMASDDWGSYNLTTYNKFYGTDLTYDELRKVVSDSYKEYYLSFRYAYSQLKKFNLRKIRTFFVIMKNKNFVMKYIKSGSKDDRV